jgi:hypothetical protein
VHCGAVVVDVVVVLVVVVVVVVVGATQVPPWQVPLPPPPPAGVQGEPSGLLAKEQVPSPLQVPGWWHWSGLAQV